MKKQTKKLLMPIVAVIFNDEDKILLTKRYDPAVPHVHGKWQLPGGGMEHGEHPKDTVLREIKEETTVSIKLLTKHPLTYSYVFKESDAHRLTLAFPAKYISGEVDISEDPETSDAKWFSYDEIDEMQSLPQTKEIIEEAMKIIQPGFN